MAAVKTRAHAKISRLGIMAKSVLRHRQFVMCVKRARSRQSATRFEFISTSVAKIALAQVNPFHRVRRSHHALTVLAMTQCERMPKFMNGFLQQALPQQGVILIQTIKLLPQPKGRYHGARSTHLRLAENIFKNWDIKIDFSHREKAPVSWPNQALHALQDFRGVKLLALGMIGGSWVQREREDLANEPATSWESRPASLRAKKRQLYRPGADERDSLRPARGDPSSGSPP